MVSLVSPERPDTEAHIFEEIRKKAAEADRESIKVGVEEKGDLGGGRHRGAGGFNSSHCPSRLFLLEEEKDAVRFGGQC